MTKAEIQLQKNLYSTVIGFVTQIIKDNEIKDLEGLLEYFSTTMEKLLNEEDKLNSKEVEVGEWKK